MIEIALTLSAHFLLPPFLDIYRAYHSSDSGGQYRDGTCDTTRTLHFGRPTPEQCEAYTRVLQGHVGLFSRYWLQPYSPAPKIAIDSAVFPEGTSGAQLDVLARKALWKDGLNYMVRNSLSLRPSQPNTVSQHGTGHGFGSFLNVHEGPQGFSSAVPLEYGHVVTNEPGFCECIPCL